MRFLLLLALPALARDPLFELDGRIEPQSQASVSIYGVTGPFADAVLSDVAGRFRFKKLLPGSYTLAAVIPGRGETRITVEIGPGTADSRQRVRVTLKLEAEIPAAEAKRRASVSARELAIPESARREMEEAQKALNRRDAASATAHLEKAVEVAPQFEAAWNNLGTIAYKQKNFERAEECFRQALAAQPEAYEALVNLGGVLINLHKLDQAKEYNHHAVLLRPNDALANSQLGMTFFELDQLDDAEKYLERARQLDPAHFSHPQLVLVQIHLRRNQPQRAAADLEDFLKYHPDWPDAQRLREQVAKLKQ